MPEEVAATAAETPIEVPAASSGGGETSEVTPEPDRDEVAAEVLADENLPVADYQRARNDPAFLTELVDTRIKERAAKPVVETPTPPAAETQPEAAAEAEGEETDETPPPEEDKPRKKGGYERQRDRERERADAAEQRAAELEAELAKARASSKPDEAPKPAAAPGRPDLDQFIAEGRSNEEYLEAVAEWKADQKVRAALEEDRKQRAEEAEKNRAQRVELAMRRALAERFDAARDKHADFDDVLEANAEIQLPDSLLHAVAYLPRGGEVLYHLMTNPGDRKRIVNLPPSVAMMEVARIDARLPEAPSAPARKVSSRQPPPPPPAKPLGGAGAGIVKDREYYEKHATIQEYMEARRSGKLG